ncbi:MAG: hypothetical protein AB7L76_17070 [Burkholderiaceae bacterium]
MNSPGESRLIYARTAEGEQQLARQGRELSQPARRVLLVIDGQRCVADLPPIVRPDELRPILAELEAQRLIEPIGLADPLSETERRARLRAEHAALEAAKKRLRGLLDAELGPAGQIWEARIEDCVSMEVLRRALREAVDVVQARRGNDAARRIVLAVRPFFDEAQRPEVPGTVSRDGGL